MSVVGDTLNVCQDGQRLFPFHGAATITHLCGVETTQEHLVTELHKELGDQRLGQWARL